MLSTYMFYNAIASNPTKALSDIEKDPSVARETAYFKANISKVKTVDDLLNNDRLYNYALNAFGLKEMSYAKGLFRKLLTQGVTSNTALANQLSDPRYKAFAKAFNFAATGTGTTQNSALQSQTVSQYDQQTLEDNQGQQNQGVQLALYFKRNAASIQSSYSILADPALLKVVQTALNIPASSSTASIDVQAKAIDSKINVADFQTPAKVDAFLKRFSTMYDMQNSTASLDYLMPYNGNDSGSVIGVDLMMSLQSIRLGG